MDINLRQASRRLRDVHHMGFTPDTLSSYIRGDMVPVLPATKDESGRWHTTEADIDAWAKARKAAKTTMNPDRIDIRVAGYEWALRQEGEIDDQDVMSAYEKLFPGASFTDEGFPLFERGALDSHAEEWITASEAAVLFDRQEDTIRKACQRAAKGGATWCRRSAGTWQVDLHEAKRRWGYV